MNAINFPSIEAIVAAIRANDGMVIDDHRAGMEPESARLRKAYAVAQYDKHVVLLSGPDDTPYFCLNRMSIDEDGKAHLSTFSVGGVIDFGRGPNRRTLNEAVARYNDPSNWLPGYNYTKVTGVVYL